MTATIIESPAVGSAEAVTRTYVIHRSRRPRRGGVGPGPAASYTLAGKPEPVTGASLRWRSPLGLAALAFDVVCLGGLAVLVWSVVAGMQPVAVLAYPI